MIDKCKLCIINLDNISLLNDDDVISMSALYDSSYLVVNKSTFVYNCSLPVTVKSYDSVEYDEYDFYVVPENQPIEHQEFLYLLIKKAMEKRKIIFSFFQFDTGKLDDKFDKSLLVDCCHISRH